MKNKMRIISIIIIFLLNTLFLFGQEKGNQSAAKLLSRISFKQVSGGVMIVKALVDNIKDSLNFILDTGSGGISLDSSTCEEFHIATAETDTTVSGIAGIKKVRFAFNKTLNFPGLSIDKLQFHIYDYGLLSSIYGEKIDGVIGYGFFSRYIIKLNFDRSQMEVYSPGKIKYPAAGIMLHPKISPLPIQSLQIKDNRKTSFDFFLDTGAGLSILISERFANDSNVLSGRRKAFTTQAEGLGGKKQMKLTVIKELKLGPYKFYNVPTYIFKDDYNVINYPISGGLIGNEILRRFNLIINYPENEIHLLPNTHFQETFEYGYTGLLIYLLQDKIFVEDIVTNSPAEKAGFKLGDEMIGVDNNFSGSIQQYKNILQETDKKMKVIIRREGKLIELELTSISIL